MREEKGRQREGPAIRLGTHISVSKGFAHGAKTAVEIGADIFQFFSRNPRGRGVKDWNSNDIREFAEIRRYNELAPLMAHAPYILNLASARDDVFAYSKEILKEDILRMDSIGIEYFNFHPGSPGAMGLGPGLEQVIEGIEYALSGEENITVLLETMSGKGSEIGSSFEQLKMIIDGLNHAAASKIGVCLDTCHVFAAGYDIVRNLDGVLSEFDKIIGLDRLKAIHLNDSMMDLGSKKDRHAPIGEGKIGMDAIINLMKHPVMMALPYYLETPLEDEGHKKEIAMLKEKIG
ncbi:MAG: deoxyribonuclease IV [Anaerovoracaceae bacterium]|jgi:deoxyribonuclease-4